MTRTTSLFLGLALLAGCGGSETPQQTVDSSVKPSAAPAATPAAEKTASSAPEKKVVTYDQLIQAADTLIDKRDAKNAIKILTTAIKAKPTQPEAYIKRAALLAEAKLFKQAVGDMSSAIGVDPENSKYRNTRGYFLLMLQDYDAAERDFNKAIDIDPEYPQAYNNRGLVFIGQNEYIKALNDFRKASDLKENYVDALNNLGFVFLQMEEADPAKAVETFTKVLEINDGYLNAISNRGRAHLALKDYDSAIKDFSRAIELQPQNQQYRMHRSEAYRAAGQFDLAREDVNQIARERQIAEVNHMIRNNPRRKELWLTRAQLLLQSDRTEEAKTALDNAIKLDGTFIPSLLSRARLHELEQEYDQVIEVCSKILDLEPNTEAQSLRGDAYMLVGKIDEAIADYEAARRFDTKIVEAYRARAEQREQAGETDLAKADQERADSLETRLTAGPPTSTEDAKPREMVVQPVSFEQVAEEEGPETK
ncbi:tetratricopeptide repeat protein [Thalassoglobus sp. JC818]|uniref:tetratricopeptide repeat protein n=1 Tax=Thalassoglobus sp. JC818 TaxID=3232136 RepID=UPI00345820A9